MSAHLIRPAVAADAGSILSLIKELAEYERSSDQVKANVDDILRDGFGQRPLFDCLIAEVDGIAVGYALYFFMWSTWTGRATCYLEDLFVQPGQRGKGVGLDLLRHCARIAVARDCQRFEWAVLDWNTPARDFYHSLGAFHKETWLPYRLEGQALLDLAQA